jgi:hypothetical protein
VSCSVHDLVRLERRGVATAGVGTAPFADEALEQAALLGMPGYRMVWVPPPGAASTRGATGRAGGRGHGGDPAAVAGRKFDC